MQLIRRPINGTIPLTLNSFFFLVSQVVLPNATHALWAHNADITIIDADISIEFDLDLIFITYMCARLT